MNDNLPNDPILLLSVVNMKLRDFYKDLDTLCQDLKVNKEDLIEELADIDYEYDVNANQFVQKGTST